MLQAVLLIAEACDAGDRSCPWENWLQISLQNGIDDEDSAMHRSLTRWRRTLLLHLMMWKVKGKMQTEMQLWSLHWRSHHRQTAYRDKSAQESLVQHCLPWKANYMTFTRSWCWCSCCWPWSRIFPEKVRDCKDCKCVKIKVKPSKASFNTCTSYSMITVTEGTDRLAAVIIWVRGEQCMQGN